MTTQQAYAAFRAERLVFVDGIYMSCAGEDWDEWRRQIEERWGWRAVERVKRQAFEMRAREDGRL